MPWFWIVAGPNGAGKSTLVDYGAIETVSRAKLVQLNADTRARDIVSADPAARNPALRAAQEIDAAVADCIDRGVDFLVETVLSTDKYIDDVERAVAAGFRIGLVYVALASPEDAMRRVELREKMGGHGVPSNRVTARWHRSLAMLPRFIPFATEAYIFDNSAPATHGGPVLIAWKASREGSIIVEARGRVPALDEVLAPFE